MSNFCDTCNTEMDEDGACGCRHLEGARAKTAGEPMSEVRNSAEWSWEWDAGWVWREEPGRLLTKGWRFVSYDPRFVTKEEAINALRAESAKYQQVTITERGSTVLEVNAIIDTSD